jgi:hypothetical protein
MKSGVRRFLEDITEAGEQFDYKKDLAISLSRYLIIWPSVPASLFAAHTPLPVTRAPSISEFKHKCFSNGSPATEDDEAASKVYQEMINPLSRKRLERQMESIEQKMRVIEQQLSLMGS